MIVSLIASLSALAQQGLPADERADAFAWFDTLGYSELLTKPFVRVEPGPDVLVGNGPRFNRIRLPEFGFLIADTPKTFKVLAPDLREVRFERNPSSEDPHFDTADFAAHLHVALGMPAPGPGATGERRTGSRPPYDMVELFVLSRTAAARSLDGLSKSLFGASKAMRSVPIAVYMYSAQPPQEWTYLWALQAWTETWLLADISLDMADPGVSRDEQLQRLERFTKLFPKGLFFALADAWKSTLAGMVVADKARAAKPRKDRAAMTRGEKIEELVYELQDQRGGRFSARDSLDVFNDLRIEPSPAHRLAAMGAPAIPRLIQALSDDRLTRSISYAASADCPGTCFAWARPRNRSWSASCTGSSPCRPPIRTTPGLTAARFSSARSRVGGITTDRAAREGCSSPPFGRTARQAGMRRDCTGRRSMASGE